MGLNPTDQTLSNHDQDGLTSIGVKYVTRKLMLPAWNVYTVRVGVNSSPVTTVALGCVPSSPTHSQVTPSILTKPAQPRIYLGISRLKSPVTMSLTFPFQNVGQLLAAGRFSQAL